MRTQKNQIALAKLEFSYRTLKKPVNVNLAKNSIQFLKQLRGKPSSGKACDWYVLFVNQNHEVFAGTNSNNRQNQLTAYSNWRV